MDWKEQYEKAADKERDQYDYQSVADLLAQIRTKQFGDYNTLWLSLAERATLAEAAPTLLTVLQDNSLDFLVRCHAAEALLRLLGRADELALLEEAVNLSRGTAAMQQPYLSVLQQELAERLV